MKKRILACLLMICMLVTMVPATAFAAEEVAPTDEPMQNEAVCICDALCTEGTVNTDCPVCGDETGYTTCSGTAAEPTQNEVVCICKALCTEETVNADCPICGGEAGYIACTHTADDPQEDDHSTPWTELTPAEQIQSAADGLLSDAAENNNYEVADSTGFTDAISAIESRDASEATITLTQNVMLSGVDELGVEGKHITITSSDADTFLLTLAKNTLRLTGDVTFENIHISANTIYAEGNVLTLGAGFGGGDDGQTRMTIYGGSDKDLPADTRVIVEDGVYKLISGGNSAGTLTGNTYVEFGGNARFPTAADGEQEGDDSTGSSAGYNLYQKAEMKSSWNPVLVSYTKHGVLPYGIYGGGINADTTGDTTVKMTGGEVYQIFGGGAAIWNPNYAESQHKNGCVEGDTNVTVAGGEVKSIYGGGYNGIDAFGGDDYEKVPDDARSTRAVVEGTAYVTIEGDALVPACEQSEDASTSGCDPAAIHGGSFHSTVGATQVVVGGDAKIETGGAERTGYGYGSLFGAGTNDIVLNTTSITLKDNARIGRDDNKLGTSAISQGSFGNMTPLGYAAKSGCYIGGATFNYGSEIKNQGSSDYAATATVAGGQVDVLGIGCKSRSTDQAHKSVTGNVLLQQTDGNIAAIEASCINNKKVTVNGNVDVKVSGGTISSYIMGRYPSMYDDDRTITGNATLEVSASGTDRYQEIPLIETMDHVTIKHGAKVVVEGNWRSYDYKGKYTETGQQGLVTDIPFFQVKGLTVENNAVLALTQKSLIEGDITVNGQLGIKRSNGFLGIGAGAKAPVTAEGIAVGNGTLLPFENNRYDQGSTPKVNEEYVYAKKDGSSMLLTLANAGNTGLYVDRKGNTDAQDVWYIAQQIPQNVTVTFDKNGGDTEAKPNQMTVPSGSAVGTLPTAPTRKNHTFLGWNTVANGSGAEFTATTPVTSDITVYAQWEKAEEQLWYYELYYQSYTPDGTLQDENGVPYNWVRQTHGQGGWAYPDDAVSISHSKFDGKQFAWDAIDGSGKETLGVHYVFDENFGPHRLSASCGEATKNNPLKIYYRATPHTVTYQYDGNVPDKAPEAPNVVHTSYSAPVTVAVDPVMDGYTFSGWTVKSPADVEITDGKLTMPNADVVLSGSWKRNTTPVDPKVAAYRVEHYQEQLNGSYTLSATEFPLYGEIGTTVTAVPKIYEHYHVNHEKSNLTGIVKMPTAGEDGTPEILTLQVYYDLDTVTVSYDLNGGTGKDGISYAPETVKYGASVTIKDAPSKSGYTFEGWNDGTTTHQPGVVLTVTSNITLTAQWHKNSSGGGGGGTTYYILHYESNGGTEYKDERYKKNTVVELDKVPTREGYTFTGWYADEELIDRITSIKMTSDKTVYAGWEPTGVPDWLNGKDHFAYVVGYMDGTVRPLNNISRAEVATIFFRLLNEDIREENLTTANTFDDVNEGMWCNTAISTMAKLGVVKGRTTAHFDPNAPITRAEFAAICARFDTSKRTGDSDFTDISGHWAEAEIERAASLGWIMGYTDGTFRPENYITRAEAMTMINRVLNRLPEDEDDLLDGMNVWPDNKPGDWYYLAVQEATNSHDFTRKGDVHEHWTKLTADPDWSRYQ